LSEPLRLTMLRRARLGGRLFKVGQMVTIDGKGHLRCAWSLCDTKQAKPADERSRVLIELYAIERKLQAEACPAT
jgi:hypothetical protein